MSNMFLYLLSIECHWFKHFQNKKQPFVRSMKFFHKFLKKVF